MIKECIQELNEAKLDKSSIIFAGSPSADAWVDRRSKVLSLWFNGGSAYKFSFNPKKSDLKDYNDTTVADKSLKFARDLAPKIAAFIEKEVTKLEKQV